MEKTDSSYKVHVFVCTNQKKGSCCADVGGDEIRSELKSWIKENPDWKKRIRINNSGCLDRCKDGVAIAIYPQNKWVINARKHDIPELKNLITDLMNAPEASGK